MRSGPKGLIHGASVFDSFLSPQEGRMWAVRGKFVRSRPPPPSLPAGFAFRIKNSLGTFRYRGSGSGGLLRAQWVFEYNPVVRSFQSRGDLILLRWIKIVPIYNNWTVIECPPRDLRSSSRIGKEGRGRKPRLANIRFCSKKFRGFAKNLP